MTLLRQQRLHNALEKLKSRNDFSEDQWIDLVAEGIRTACSSKSTLYKQVVTLRGTSETKVTDATEKECIKLLTTAQTMLEITPSQLPDTELER